MIIGRDCVCAAVSAVHDGYVLKKSIIKSPIGGHFLTKCMQHTIEEKGITIRPRYAFKREEKGGTMIIKDVDCSNVTESFRAYHVDAICQDAKHAVCRQLSDNPFNPEENANIPNVTYELPDGQEIHIGPQRFSIPELLFNPVLSKDFGDVGKGVSEITNIEKMGLPQIVAECIGKCDIDVRRELFNSIILTGGTSLFASLQKRLEDEVINMAPSMMKVRVTSPSNAIEKRYSTWIGGSILASLGTFQQMWMSKAEYKEYGAGLIHKKAP